MDSMVSYIKKAVADKVEKEIDEEIEKAINIFNEKLINRKNEFISEIMKKIMISQEENLISNVINYTIIFKNIES